MKETNEVKLENLTDVKNGDVNCRLSNENVDREMEKCEPLLTQNVNIESKTKKKQKILSKISEHMDLDLLKDRRYIAVILGNFIIFSLLKIIIHS